MARFGRAYPLGAQVIQGAFGEQISQTVVLESNESNQILNSLTMAINSAVTVTSQDLVGSSISYVISGIDMGMTLGSLGISIFEPINSPPIDPSRIRLTMGMKWRNATPETVSFELPPGKWKKPTKHTPRRRPWNQLGYYEDTEYEIGIDFAPIVARSGWWVVSTSSLRDSIVIRSEASISQDPKDEGRP